MTTVQLRGDQRWLARIVAKVRKRLMGDPQEPSVLAGMPTFEWDSARSVRYEVAVEAISQAVAAYTVLIRQATDAGDTAEAERLTELQSACAQARRGLRSDDAAAVDQVVREYRALTEQLRAQIR